ncbi:hypothetical protein P7H41_13065 [Vagococcus fluvialis]|uniref:hypothetical protein n=1 Tax=Vagococcus fluvialis TaxID=2738 RepID=UPI002892517B|nr:hypothetical protein [Vagococcus fluvialis]MDT2782873.1 hypothetical protein [Vagococcus fluvialis]
MSLFIYRDHLNGALFSNPDYEPERCEECGDIDDFIGEFSNANELRKTLSDSDGWCGYDKEYLESIFKE